MRDFFSRHEGATWPESERLHVYLRGNHELRGVVGQYQEVLRRSGVAEAHGLGLQDLEFLHCTVQMLAVYRRQVPPSQLAELAEQLSTDLAAVEPFTLRVGPPQASQHAVEMWIDPQVDEQWRRLVHTVRSSVADALGADALPPITSNGTPHTSLGYGISDGDSGAITSALKGARPRPPMVEVDVRELEVVAVTQHPREGRFTWDTHAHVRLASGDEA